MKLRHLFAAAVAPALLACFQASQAAETAKWEYRVVNEAQLLKEAAIVLEKEKENPELLQRNQELALKKMGDAGWELASVVKVDKNDVMRTSFHVFYFKKPIAPPAPPPPAPQK